jgi:putative FmdB family regulatory protein
MPLYEYECEQDGTVIELLRPMAEADKAVDDPEGKGRVYKRRHSVFASGGVGSVASPARGCCPCGKPHGSCSRD